MTGRTMDRIIALGDVCDAMNLASDAASKLEKADRQKLQELGVLQGVIDARKDLFCAIERLNASIDVARLAVMDGNASDEQATNRIESRTE